MRFPQLKKMLAFVLLGLCGVGACKHANNTNRKPVDQSIPAPLKKDTQQVKQSHIGTLPALKSIIRPKVDLKLGEIYADTLEFVEFDDNGDYPYLYAKKGDEIIPMIYDQSQKMNFLRSDLLVVKWKIDSMWIAGDGDKLVFAEWAINAKKIKDGSVALFRKKYKKPIKYWSGKDESYTNEYKDYLYKAVEYYLANSKAPLVLENLKDPNVNLTYSIEKGEKNGRSYTILGISRDLPDQSSIIQWLYLDVENHNLYEYDLANDELNRVI